MDGSLVLRPLHSAHAISLVSFICISEGGTGIIRVSGGKEWGE